MLIFGTEMHLVTGLLVLLELFLLGAQLTNWVYFPHHRRELLYLWLLVLMILYNIFGGLYPDPKLSWPSLKVQNILAWGSGFAVAAYIPYYFYAAFELGKLRFFAIKGMLFFLALPFFLFFVLEYCLKNNIDFAIHWGLIAPAIYGVAFLWSAFIAIRERYQLNLASERLEMYLTYAAVFPWVFMAPISYLKVTQLTEVLTTNTGFLVITAILIIRSVREKREDLNELKRWKQDGSRLPNEALFEKNLLKYGFSARELDVVRLLREGYTKQEVGEKLFIAVATVSRHTQNIYYKADVNNRIELMRKLETEE